MAKLLNTQTNERIPLRSQHIFGRHSASSNTVLENAEASRLHASILWNGGFWMLQDTSSNGTFLNDVAMVSGSKRRLKQGDVIKFGALDACGWVLENDDEPKSMLYPLTQNTDPIELEGMLVLPDAKTPQLTFYQLPNEDWVCESQSGLIELESGTKVSTHTDSWYFVDANTFERTQQATNKGEISAMPVKVDFTVSKNEEHVSLSILFDNIQIDLGERAHHYLMLFLARRRLHDLQSGIEDSEQGWLDKEILCQQTGLDEKHINLHIYRFRKQLIQAQPAALQLIQIIERRRGELRFAFKSVEVHGGNELSNSQ